LQKHLTHRHAAVQSSRKPLDILCSLQFGCCVAVFLLGRNTGLVRPCVCVSVCYVRASSLKTKRRGEIKIGMKVLQGSG